MNHHERIKHTEEWRDVVGYEGYYQVSDRGRVKGLERIDSRGRLREERVLKPLLHYKGYRTIHLHKDGHCKTVKLHRAVASAFLEDFSDKKQVDHIDGDRSNNMVENLRMATNSENKANMKKISGLSSKYKGVYWHKATGKWCAAVKKDGRPIHIGTFCNEVDAARAYDEKVVNLFGEFSNTNENMGLLNDAP
jgi:hypothetical protein